MNITFEVGDKEKHTVGFHFNQFWGNLNINIDGNTVLSNFEMMSFQLVNQYRFQVGINEVHYVLIEKERKLLLAGFRNHKYRVYIDGVLIKELEGM